MSLVGTRPILQDELQKYELHHRARIAIKPGITGMWQVSGRSDITDFEEVVRLDTEYISKEDSQMTNLNSLFLSQAYKDCWDDYNRSLKLRSFPRWDYVILTASNEQQAEGFRKQIEFMGIAYTEEDLYAHVLAMEQIMSTGGGWQDQVGGITPGLKYITSMPGLQQQLQVAHIELSPQTKKELDERFVLIYTGQRRLARNLLRDVVGRYVGNEPDSLFALEEIQKTAALMRFELERGNVDGFAKLLDYHWELSKKIDAGSSNTLIEQIFSSIEELVDGKLVCGAGGGGFLQVILKKGVTRQMVEERLKEVFMDSLVGVADCNLVWE